ncbi:uncharacterized protein LOC124144610 [Haliotis rufescens]|uniref:uncharacterized protein LOC124144610 n=1 Tax=Haliotis rufescens TaxID=6454 RepID=UPI001EB07230|nr:uncharacterized protein LOC124144610 [Haliotis rufescens]
MAVAADAETSESFDPNGYFKNANGGIFSEVELAGETDPLRSGNAVEGGENSPNSEVYNIPVLETKPPNYMWLALCTTVFFNPLSGIIALVLAMQADGEYMRNNCERARCLGRAVKIICVVSIAATILILIIVSSFFVPPPTVDVST